MHDPVWFRLNHGRKQGYQRETINFNYLDGNIMEKMRVKSQMEYRSRGVWSGFKAAGFAPDLAQSGASLALDTALQTLARRLCDLAQGLTFNRARVKADKLRCKWLICCGSAAKCAGISAGNRPAIGFDAGPGLGYLLWLTFNPMLCAAHRCFIRKCQTQIDGITAATFSRSAASSGAVKSAVRIYP